MTVDDQEEDRLVWRGSINSILYVVQFNSRLTDAVAQKIANMIRGGKVLSGGIDRFLPAIKKALAQDGPLNDVIETPHSEEGIRSLLRKVEDLLEET